MFVLVGTSVYAQFNSTEATPQPSLAVKQVKQSLPTANEMLSLINAEREKKGVAPLKIDERLNQSAQWKADDMKEFNYFGHVRESYHGYEKAVELNQECIYASENITKNIYSNTSSAAVNAWINSPSHFAAMVDSRYDTTGFGVSGEYIVQHFCDLR